MEIDSIWRTDMILLGREMVTMQVRLMLLGLVTQSGGSTAPPACSAGAGAIRSRRGLKLTDGLVVDGAGRSLSPCGRG